METRQNQRKNDEMDPEVKPNPSAGTQKPPELQKCQKSEMAPDPAGFRQEENRPQSKPQLAEPKSHQKPRNAENPKKLAQPRKRSAKPSRVRMGRIKISALMGREKNAAPSNVRNVLFPACPFPIKKFDFLNSMESAIVGAEIKWRMAIVSARPHCFRGDTRGAHLAD